MHISPASSLFPARCIIRLRGFDQHVGIVISHLSPLPGWSPWTFRRDSIHYSYRYSDRESVTSAGDLRPAKSEGHLRQLGFHFTATRASGRTCHA
jgi:hypothetical protein